MKRKTLLGLTMLFAVFLSSCSDGNSEFISVEDQLLELMERSSLKKNVLILKGIQNNQILYEVRDGFELGFSLQRTSGDEVCRSSGIVFARCVRDALDAGLCLYLYADGDEYVAEEAECQANIGQAS